MAHDIGHARGAVLRSTGAGRAHGQPAREGRLAGLDGLRAIAVVAVLVFHLSADALPGGYLGVDVFFVVSGFLITTLLLREIAATGRIGLRNFWLRRARRLLPALCLVVVVCVSAARVVGGDLLVDLDRQVLGALTFSTNWLEIAAGSSYFTHTAPLLFVTFWSLAVEEQFYLVWPVALAVVLAVVPARHRVRVVLGVAAVSAVLMAVLVVPGQDPTRVYYGTDTHAFGLMIGAALALARERGPALAGPRLDTGSAGSRELWPSLSVPARTVVGVAGLAGLVTLMLTLPDTATFAYRGGILLASVCTAVVIAAVAGSPAGLGRVLDAAPFAWVGQRSYGLYLWHWPALLILAAAMPAAVAGSPSWWTTRIVALTLTVVLAAASYRWVETPVRRDGFRAVLGRAVGACRASAPGPATWPRIGVAVAASLVVGTGAVALTAPDQSATERAILAGEAQLEDRPVVTAPAPGPTPVSAPPPPAAPGDRPDAAPAPLPSEDPGQVPPALVPTGEEITAFGDSMVVTSLHGLTSRFPGIDVQAKSVLQWPQGADVVRAALRAGTVRRAVVLAYGTNAGVRDPDLVRDLVRELGPDRMIVLVSVYQYSYWVPETNARLAEIADEFDNVVLADWAGAISERPDLLQSDRIHPGVEGGHLYAEVIEDALTALAASPA